MHKPSKLEHELTEEISSLKQIIQQLEKSDTVQRPANKKQKIQPDFNQLLLDTIPVPIFYKDARGVYLGCNKAYEDFFKIKRDEFIGKSVYDISVRALADIYHARDLDLLQNPGTQVYESTIIDTAGKKHNVMFHKSTYNDLEGKIAGLIGAIFDITSLRKSEAALIESEIKFKTFSEQSLVGVYLIQDGFFKYINPKFAEMFGYTVEECLNDMPYENLLHKEDIVNVREQIRRRMSGETNFVQYTFRGMKKNRQIFNVEIYGSSSVYKGKPAVSGTILDITERKIIENALRESEVNFRTFFDTIDDMIIVGSPDGRIIYSNPAMIMKTGYNSEELKNLYILDLHPKEMRKEAEEIFQAMFRGELDVCPLPLQNSTGGLIPVETRVWFGKWSGYSCIFGVCKDLTREQEAIQKFNRLFNSNPAPMAVSSIPDKKFTDVNESFLNVLGYSMAEVIGRTSNDLGLFPQMGKHEEISDLLLVSGHISNQELQVRCKNGKILEGLFSGEMIESQGKKFFLTVMIDQTERKRMIEDLEIHRKHLEDMVSQRTSELETKNISLLELNSALKVLLKQREDDKKDMEDRFVLNIRNLVLPYVEQLKKGHLDAAQKTYLDIIEAHLSDISMPFLKNLQQFNLTPKEIKVATLIKQGKSTKEIAETLNLAGGSIDVHRKNIRAKLKLRNRKANLSSFLANLE